MRAQRAAEDRGDVAGRGQQRLEVDAGVDAHLVQHRDEVLRGDVARGAGRDGAPAELAEARLEGLAAGFERRQDVREALAARVVEVGGQLDLGPELGACVLEEPAHLARVGHPGRVAEPDLLGPGVAQSARDPEHARLGDVALVGAAEADADHPLAAQARLAGAAEHALEAAERLLDRAVDVLAVVRLAGAQEDVDLVEPVAQRQRVLQPPLVRDQHRQAHVVRHVDAGEHVGRVGQLRDDVRPHEARDLQPLEAGRCEQLDQPHLIVGRHHLGLVLEPVPGPDLADVDVHGG